MILKEKIILLILQRIFEMFALVFTPERLERRFHMGKGLRRNETAIQKTECRGIMMHVCTKHGVTKPLDTGPHTEEEPHQPAMWEASGDASGTLVCMAGRERGEVMAEELDEIGGQ